MGRPAPCSLADVPTLARGPTPVTEPLDHLLNPLPIPDTPNKEPGVLYASGG